MNDLIFLSLLLPGPLHGYALKRRGGLISGQTELHNNIVYPLLRRFMARGWVTRRKAAGERGQTRQVYSLTARGRRALFDRVCAFDDRDASSREAFLFRVGFFDALDAEARARIIAGRKKFLASRIARLLRMESEMQTGRYGGEAVRYLRAEAARELAWIARLVRRGARNQGISKKKIKKDARA
ncbi:MAG: PadR family transcriptional regulator [Candidatus Acidiferrales bacterium]